MGKRATALKNLPKGGRPKGSKNKFTNLKQAFLDAFEGIGGAKELEFWAKQTLNRRDFYNMITKLLPKDVKVGGEGGGPISITFMPPEPKTVEEWIKAKELIDKEAKRLKHEEE